MQTTKKNFAGAGDRRRENSDNDQREFSRGTYPGAVLRFINFDKQTLKLICLMGYAIEFHAINEQVAVREECKNDRI